MQLPRAILFDLDETLAESFQPPTTEMLEQFERILARMPTAIITGGSYARLRHDFLAVLRDTMQLPHLYLFPDSSAQCYTYQDGIWGLSYSLATLSTNDKDAIIKAILDTIDEMPEFKNTQSWGQCLIDRNVQIAYTVVGTDAPQDAKMNWDPDHSKRIAFCTKLQARLPDFEVLVGGASTIDVTRRGIDKSYGVKWFSSHLQIPVSEMLYVGDALFPGGNDFVVKQTGIPTHSVTGPRETLEVIRALLEPESH